MFQRQISYSIACLISKESSAAQKTTAAKDRADNQEAKADGNATLTESATEVLEISQTNEFDANFASIQHKLQETEAQAKIQSTDVIDTTGAASVQFSGQMSSVKQGLTSVVNVTLPSQVMRRQQQ